MSANFIFKNDRWKMSLMIAPTLYRIATTF